MENHIAELNHKFKEIELQLLSEKSEQQKQKLKKEKMILLNEMSTAFVAFTKGPIVDKSKIHL